jgi:SAM-dependent methyltransferase
MTTQDGVFVASEGDRWFERNSAAIERLDPKRDLVTRLFDLYQLAPKTIAELGAANGFRVAALAERLGAKATAVEPSARAIADGRARFPHVEYLQGEARALPLAQDRQFDVVIINFVLHWIDRSTLLRSVSEVDRVVADGGYLLIGDFYPWVPTQVKYHHLPDAEVYTYKQDYAEIFLASRTYQPVGLLTADGHTISSDVDDDRRYGAWLLRKRLRGGYKLGVFPTPAR